MTLGSNLAIPYFMQKPSVQLHEHRLFRSRTTRACPHHRGVQQVTPQEGAPPKFHYREGQYPEQVWPAIGLSPTSACICWVLWRL